MSDGITVMHLGDADPDDDHYAPYDAHWMATRTDTAYPPYWFFGMGDGPQILSTRLNTLTATGIHVPVSAVTGNNMIRAATNKPHITCIGSISCGCALAM